MAAAKPPASIIEVAGLAGDRHPVAGGREEHGEERRAQERPACDMGGGVARAEHGPGGLAQQVVAVEEVARRPCAQEQRRVGEQVLEHRARRHDPGSLAVGDEPGTAIDDQEQRRGRERQERHGVLDPIEQRQPNR